MAGAAASVALLALIAAVHVYWALGGRAGKSAAIPERNGLPVIEPGALATFAVAIALLAAAGVVATQAGLIFAGAFQPYALILRDNDLLLIWRTDTAPYAGRTDQGDVGAQPLFLAGRRFFAAVRQGRVRQGFDRHSMAGAGGIPVRHGMVLAQQEG